MPCHGDVLADFLNEWDDGEYPLEWRMAAAFLIRGCQQRGDISLAGKKMDLFLVRDAILVTAGRVKRQVAIGLIFNLCN